MKILSINAKSFRSLEDVNIEFESKYCTLSGKNNAGKSNVINIITKLLQEPSRYTWREKRILDYSSDHTQWDEEKSNIEINIDIQFSKIDDPNFFNFIAKFSQSSKLNEVNTLRVSVICNAKNEISYIIELNDEILASELNPDIIQKLKTSNLLFLHNSTGDGESRYVYSSGILSAVLNNDQKAELRKAEKSINAKIAKFSREQRDELNSLIGRLSEDFDVELRSPEFDRYNHVPLEIELKNKAVQIPLLEWGSGTKNKTQILMSILSANRIKTSHDESKNTPILLIEEPESFLHPTAQAEFGAVLQGLAEDLGIQIIATTHSPYMLNLRRPNSNILLDRNVKRKKVLGTSVVSTKGENWQLPFAEQLGINPPGFEGWENILTSRSNALILVEGVIDKSYFDFLTSKFDKKYSLPEGTEFYPYGGKDNLKNQTLVKFARDINPKTLITFDLDAKQSVEGTLKNLGLKQNVDYLPIGLNSTGRQCIEGLVPQRVISKVFADNPDIAIGLSASGQDQRKCRALFKKKVLEEFVSTTEYTDDELVEFKKLIDKFRKALK